MKRITRTYRPVGNDLTTTVWLDQYGHWTHEEEHAHVFEDDEAERRVRRIPHAELESIENNANEEEK